jgi:hypothetical protein
LKNAHCKFSISNFHFSICNSAGQGSFHPMRLFSFPGATRAQLRGALLTIPFDLPVPVPSTGTPERTFSAAPRGDVFFAAARGEVFAAAPRGSVFEIGQR